MKCDNEAVWIEFLSYQHQKEERKKQDVMSEMAYLKVQNEHECILCVEYQKYRKKRKHEHPWECNL